MADGISPQQIENAQFTTALHGYKREEVDALLHRAADAYDRALKEILSLQIKADKPYQALGEEAGALLQNAKESAVDLKRRSEEAARKIRDDARRGAER